MLSILIPTYNYDATPLVESIYNQCKACDIQFEVIVIDDGSKSILNKKNKEINNLDYCTFKALDENSGRSGVRNLLAKTAKFNWLLFLDVDVIPKNKKLISNYLPYLSDTVGIVYGGIEYSNIKPEDNKILRWKYGKKREALKAADRNKNKYLRFLTLNFLIHKDVFKIVKFNENIPNLRHEDTLFALDLKTKQITLKHIDNPIIHLGLDTNKIYLKKSLESVDALALFLDKKYIDGDNVLLSNVYFKTKSLGLNFLFAWFYKNFKAKFERHLKSKSPNLRVFDLYRLCYLCYSKQN